MEKSIWKTLYSFVWRSSSSNNKTNNFPKTIIEKMMIKTTAKKVKCSSMDKKKMMASNWSFKRMNCSKTNMGIKMIRKIWKWTLKMNKMVNLI